jgi:serine/threonine-protein kinase
MRQMGEEEICPRCGYRYAPNPKGGFLQPKTIILDRYLVGRLVSKNTQSATYIGFDTETESRIEIKEFYPRSLALRNEEGEVLPLASKEVLFKTLKSEFFDLYLKLQKLKTLNNIPRIFDLFENGGTVFAITEKKDMMKFSDYLSFKKESLSADKLKDMFKPLLMSLATLNDMGIFHRRISPDNIFVDKYENLSLGDFGIASLMDKEVDITSLKAGYSAPELYSERADIGGYSDVYSIGAVMYNALCKAEPPSFEERIETGVIIAPKKLNDEVSSSLSDLILKAMDMDPENRIQSIRGFMELFDAVMPIAPSDKPINKDEAEDGEKGSNKSAIVVWCLVAAAILCLFGVIALLLLSGNKKNPSGGDNKPPVTSSAVSSEESSSNSSEENSSENEDREYAAVDCIGKNYGEIVNNKSYTDRYTFEIKYEFSDEFDEGLVISQDPLPDEPIALHGTITLTVSKGAKNLDIPNYKGVKVENYVATLMEMGILESNITKAIVDNNEAGPGEVVEVFLPSGETKINREQIDLVKIVVMYKGE